MKKIIFNIFCFYNLYFPVNRGKHFLSGILNRIFGVFNVKIHDNYFDVYINSAMDLSYFNEKNISNNIIIENIQELAFGSVFIDIGANIGYYSVLASKKVGEKGKIFSFEPSYREYRRLLNSISYNKCKNIIPFNIALSDVIGVISMDVSKTHTGLNRITGENRDYLVPMFRLDSLIGEFNVDKVDFIKIDVEGAEYLVLRGMTDLLEKKIIKKMLIEITPKFLTIFGHSKEMIYKFLYGYGYVGKVNSSAWQYDELFVLEDNNRIKK